MGSWGGGAFENDTAMDFLGAEPNRDALMAVFATADGAGIAADDAERIIAAADIVAAMQGRPGVDTPEAARTLAGRLGAPDLDLVEAAKGAVSAVLGGSELTELWDEAGPGPFNTAVTQLIARLNPEVPYDPPEPPPEEDFERTCLFCGGGIPRAELFSLTLHDMTAAKEAFRATWFCHLPCLNARMPARHIIQDWKISAEFMEREIDRLG